MIYVFDDYTIDTQCYELRHGGVLCKLEPQVFNVLAYLLEHHTRVVGKDELLEQFWPQQFVSAVVVNQRVMAVRKALGPGTALYQNGARARLSVCGGGDACRVTSGNADYNGQHGKGKRVMTAVEGRRAVMVAALKQYPVGSWVQVDDFFRFSFLTTTERRARVLHNTGPALLIECADAEIADLVAHHECTKQLCQRTGERHGVVWAAAEEQFRKALHTLGYGMPRV